jgi:hypothetical protein
MSLSRQEQIQQQVAAAAVPLVVRNKRGRKVTLLLFIAPIIPDCLPGRRDTPQKPSARSSAPIPGS